MGKLLYEDEDPKYELTAIRSSKEAVWKWKMNFNCWTCGKFKGIDSTLFEDDNGKLITGVICEDCFNKWKEEES